MTDQLIESSRQRKTKQIDSLNTSPKAFHSKPEASAAPQSVKSFKYKV